MSNWPESNSSDIENRCESTHPEDPDIRCELLREHPSVHLAWDHWWAR